jgi:hypothetical protein
MYDRVMFMGQNAWVLWFDNPVKRLGAKDWSSNLKKVATFDVVEVLHVISFFFWDSTSPLLMFSL